MPKVADTPEVTGLPKETPLVQATAPKMNIIDYSSQFRGVGRNLSEAMRAKTQQDTEDSKVKIQDAVNKYMFRVSPWLVGEKGPLKKYGDQVLGKDKSGKDFFLSSTSKMSGWADMGVEEFAMNSEEEAEYRRQLLKIDKGYLSSLTNHYEQQKHQWRINTYATEGERAALNITQGGDVTANLSAIEASVRKAKALNGEPIDSVLIHTEAQNLAGQGVQQHLQTLVAMGREEDANIYLAKETTQKALTPEMKIATHRYMQAALEAKATKVSADNAVWQFDREQSQEGKLTTTVVQNGGLPESYVKGTPEVLGNLTPEQYDALDPRRKAEYNRKGLMQVIDRYGGNTDMAMLEVVLVQDGFSPDGARTRVQEGLAKAAQEGRVFTLNEGRDLLSSEGKSRLTRMVNQYKTDVAKDVVPTYDNIYKLISDNSPFATKEELHNRTMVALSKATEQKQMRDAQNSASISAIWNNIRNGGDVLDYKSDPAYQNLQPSQRALLDKVIRRYAIDKTYDKIGDSALFAELNLHPEQLKQLTDGDFILLGANLSSQQMEILERQRDAMKAGVEMTGTPDLKTAQEYIKNNWYLFNDASLDPNKTEGKEKLGFLLAAVEPKLRELALTGKSSRENVEAVVKNTLMTSFSSLGGGVTRLANMKSVNANTRKALADMLGTEPEALTGRDGVLAMSKILYDPFAEIDTSKIPLDARARILDVYEKTHEGRAPDDRLLAVMYLMSCQQDKLQLKQFGTEELAHPLPKPGVTEYLRSAPVALSIGDEAIDEDALMYLNSDRSEANINWDLTTGTGD